MSLWAKDRGKSEGWSVMDRIGDETIAPTRKGADFRVVAYREIGLLTNPEGMDASLRWRNASISDGIGRV